MSSTACAQPPASQSHLEPPRADAGSQEYRDWLIQNLPLVRQVVLAVCRRGRLAPDDQADFMSAVSVKLIDGEYTVLRRFRGRSGFRTYLFVIVHRFLLDWRNSQWGKWRPSSRARRLGGPAVLLERLTVRDGLSIDEAITTFATLPGTQPPAGDLRALYARLPTRSARRQPAEPVEPLADVIVGAAAAPDSPLERWDLEQQAARVGSALRRILASLDQDERHLLRRRFARGESMADIARALGIDQKDIYRRFASILRRIRRMLESAALTQSDVAPLIGHAEIQLGSALEQSSAVLACEVAHGR